MRTHREGGFTVIEVIMFLAITGLLLMVAMTGVSSRIAVARFSDSTRGFESFLQQQYDEVINGVNARSGNETCEDGGEFINPGLTSTPGMSSQCLLLGKYIYFRKGSSMVTVYQIVGRDPSDINNSDGDMVAIQEAEPHVVTSVGSRNYSIPWDAPVYDTRRDNGASEGSEVDSFLIIRSPVSSSIQLYTFLGGDPTTVAPNIEARINTSNLGKQTNICINSRDTSSSFAAITIAKNGYNQDAIASRSDITDANRADICEGS